MSKSTNVTQDSARTLLGSYFPMIRTKDTILQEIQDSPKLTAVYENWNLQQRQLFLDACTGVRGVKVLYDAFFKEIMNPEYTPERLERFLSLVLKQHVKVVQVLPNDSSRIAEENALLIMDIVVELSDGSIANVEVQKIGYRFPGERCACYSADLLLRQYKRVRADWKGKRFSYENIKNVYTIVLFEKSPAAFQAFPEVFLHHSAQKTDTGVKINLLQEYNFITLDIFRKNIYNREIRNELDAWLTFFSVDEPERIVELFTKYPMFRSMYEQIYNMCLNMENVMGLFSKELKQLDDNTVAYMIDELQELLDKEKEHAEQAEARANKAEQEALVLKEELQRLRAQLEEK